MAIVTPCIAYMQIPIPIQGLFRVSNKKPQGNLNTWGFFIYSQLLFDFQVSVRGCLASSINGIAGIETRANILQAS